MILAVLDTNTLASCAIASTGPLAILRDAWQRRQFDVVVSSHILGELERALSKPYFVQRLDEQTREAYLTFARTSTTMTAITTPLPDVAMTRGDNLILATAESAGAAFIVTGDAELLRLRAYKTIAIVSARQFVDVLELESSPTA